METRAVAKYVRISPHKVRLVTNILVGKKVAEALGILKFTPKRAAKVIEKTIKSAVANAEQHPDVDV
ncbi:MAG TPA: 50S ribosomal protein L22, partial [Candidatus Desulfofervidus auxilii]|nr:50S ribosomal protein L22 [Candidatus Desulfofervidus auxilii]